MYRRIRFADSVDPSTPGCDAVGDKLLFTSNLLPVPDGGPDCQSNPVCYLMLGGTAAASPPVVCQLPLHKLLTTSSVATAHTSSSIV